MTTLEAFDNQRPATPDTAHEHSWCLESRHPTSIGQVLYVRCGLCGTRRVDLQEPDRVAPAALTKELQPPPGTAALSPASTAPETN